MVLYLRTTFQQSGTNSRHVLYVHYFGLEAAVKKSVLLVYKVSLFLFQVVVVTGGGGVEGSSATYSQ